MTEGSEKVWKEIEDNPDIQYFGAIDNGRVVSTCYAAYIPNLTRGNRGICFIENVVTDKDYRNCGLASKVIDMAVSFAKASTESQKKLSICDWSKGLCLLR